MGGRDWRKKAFRDFAPWMGKKEGTEKIEGRRNEGSLEGLTPRFLGWFWKNLRLKPSRKVERDERVGGSMKKPLPISRRDPTEN